jgi:hypothetical protein
MTDKLPAPMNKISKKEFKKLYPDVDLEYLCAVCAKQIWAINTVSYKLGVEKPVHLHAVCYDRLQTNAIHHYEALKKSIEGF